MFGSRVALRLPIGVSKKDIDRALIMSERSG
jgi:hypothetical protein